VPKVKYDTESERDQPARTVPIKKKPVTSESPTFVKKPKKHRRKRQKPNVPRY
jgi:hypothetical protein